MPAAPKALSAARNGREAEQLAADVLARKGYHIIASNYRHKRSEIDIIAQNGLFVVFVEVKMRISNAFGYPEEAVTEKKAETVRRGAEGWMTENNFSGPIRFDIIAVEGTGPTARITHFEDAF